MASCAICGKTAQSGQNVSFSQRKTKRLFRPNLQKVTVIENGRPVKRMVCAKCIRTMVKV